MLSSFPFSSASSAAPPLPHTFLPLPHSGASSSFPSTSFASAFAPSYLGGSLAVVQGFGWGCPPFPPFVPAAPSSHTGLPFTAAAAATASHASAFDPHAPASAPRFEDPLSGSEDRPLEDDVAFADPSAPPLSLDSSRSEYRRMAEYILGLFPQAAGAPPSAPPPWALFESFFAASAPSPPTLHFNWFDRVHQSLTEADSHMAAFLATSRWDSSFLPSHHLSYVVRGEHSGATAVPVNESLLAHFDRPLRPNLLVGLSVRDAMALEASFRGQSETLSYALWVLSGLLGFVRLQGFTPTDPALFNQLVTALSKNLAHQASVTASQVSYICNKRRELYLSHLPTYFTDSTKRSILESPAVFSDLLFAEEDVARLLDVTRSSSRLRSQQAMVDVASYGSSSSSSHGRRPSPRSSPSRSSPARRRRREFGSPARAQKRVRFDSTAPSSGFKSSRKSSRIGVMSPIPQSRRVPCGLLGSLGVLGRRPLGCAGAAFGVPSSLCFPATFVTCATSPPQLLPHLCSGVSSLAAVQDLQSKDAIEPASPELGFYSRLFVTPKVMGSWRPVIDLSRFNRFVRLSRFHMETLASVLQSLRPGDWMVSINLQDAYLQVPVHLDLRRFLHFCLGSEVFKFKALCFGLSSAPQVFTRVMAPVSSIMHRSGFNILIPGRLAHPRILVQDLVGEGLPLMALWSVGHYGQSRQKCPHSGSMTRLSRDDPPVKPFEGFPDTSLCPESARARRRIQILSAAAARSLMLSSGGHVLSFSDCPRLQAPHAVAPTPTSGCGSSSVGGRTDLLGRLLPPGSSVVVRCRSSGGGGISGPSSPGLDSVYGRLGLWLGGLSRLRTPFRLVVLELFPIFHQPPGTSGDLLGSGRFPSPSAPSVGGPVHWQHHCLVVPAQERGDAFLHSQRGGPGDPLPVRGSFHSPSPSVHSGAVKCHCSQVLSSEWTLCQEVCQELFRLWPVTVDLFATSLNHRLQVYFSLLVDPQAVGTDAMLQPWNHLQAYTFPPFGFFPWLLAKVCLSRGLEMTLLALLWPLKPWFPDLLELLVEVPVLLPLRKDLLKQPHFHHFHLNLPSLQLTGYCIASDTPVISDSLRKRPTNLPGAVGPSPESITRPSGWPIATGVIVMATPFHSLPYLRLPISCCIFVVLSIFPTPPLPLIVLCLVLSFASFFLTFPLTLSFMICFAPSA